MGWYNYFSHYKDRATKVLISASSKIVIEVAVSVTPKKATFFLPFLSSLLPFNRSNRSEEFRKSTKAMGI